MVYDISNYFIIVSKSTQISAFRDEKQFKSPTDMQEKSFNTQDTWVQVACDSSGVWTKCFGG